MEELRVIARLMARAEMARSVVRLGVDSFSEIIDAGVRAAEEAQRCLILPQEDEEWVGRTWDLFKATKKRIIEDDIDIYTWIDLNDYLLYEMCRRDNTAAEAQSRIAEQAKVVRTVIGGALRGMIRDEDMAVLTEMAGRLEAEAGRETAADAAGTEAVKEGARRGTAGHGGR